MSLQAGTKSRRRTGRAVVSKQYTSADDEERRQTIEIIVDAVELLAVYNDEFLMRVTEFHGIEYVAEVRQFAMEIAITLRDDVRSLEENMGQMFRPTHELSGLGFEVKERGPEFVIVYYKNRILKYFPEIANLLF